MTEHVSAPRAVRGLVLGFILSVVNLLGAFLTIAALGGLGAWTAWEFIGLFALVEVATGIGFIVGPNIWHLPVAQAATHVEVRLAASTLVIPHWAAGAKAVAGAVLLIATAVYQGVGPATAGVPFAIIVVLGMVIGLSLLAARFGVARPDLDVVQFVVKRPRRPDRALPGMSISASVVQLVINIGAFPLVKLLPPSVLYRPEAGPSGDLLGWAIVVCAALLLPAYAVWHGRMSWRAPPEQQREAERVA